MAVNTDAGGTGTSDTYLVEGIVEWLDIVYHASAGAGTDVYVRENRGGAIVDKHQQLNTNTDTGPTAPSSGQPWIVDGAVNVFVTGAGGALTAAATVRLEVVIA